MTFDSSVAQATFDLSQLMGQDVAVDVSGVNYVEDLCDVQLWDMEQRLEAYRELYKKINDLGRKATNKKQVAGVNKLRIVVGAAAKDLSKAIDSYCGDGRDNDEITERDISSWERSSMLLEYIEESIDTMTASQALKLAGLCDRRNKLSKDNHMHMGFSFYVAAQVILQAKLVSDGWGKVKYRAAARLNWALTQYDKYNVESFITKTKTAHVEYNEAVGDDDDVTDVVSVNTYSLGSIESVIDLKDYCLREAAARCCDPRDILAEIEEKSSSWL